MSSRQSVFNFNDPEYATLWSNEEFTNGTRRTVSESVGPRNPPGFATTPNGVQRFDGSSTSQNAAQAGATNQRPQTAAGAAEHQARMGTQRPDQFQWASVGTQTANAGAGNHPQFVPGHWQFHVAGAGNQTEHGATAAVGTEHQCPPTVVYVMGGCHCCCMHRMMVPNMAFPMNPPPGYPGSSQASAAPSASSPSSWDYSLYGQDFWHNFSR